MKLIIDDAHIDLIKKIYEYYPVDGVTTNPSILAKSGRQPFEVLKEIRSFIGEEAELHVQVVAKDADGMVDDAHRIVKELGANTYVKVPSIPEGFKAMKALAKEKYQHYCYCYLYSNAGLSCCKMRCILRSSICKPYRQYGIQRHSGSKTDS